MEQRELNTGELRNLAHDCELNQDWENAAKNYSLAIERYPRSMKVGELYKRDIELLQERVDRCLHAANMVRR
jgi:hypothetical protein